MISFQVSLTPCPNLVSILLDTIPPGRGLQEFVPAHYRGLPDMANGHIPDSKTRFYPIYKNECVVMI